MNSAYYNYEVDQISDNQWTKILHQFDDASLYQTNAYGRNYPGGKNLSHIILKTGNKIVAAAQVRILTIPIIERGVAHSYWGPLWRRKGEPADKNVLRQMLKVLYDEYVLKRKLLLRLISNLPSDHSEDFESVFREINIIRQESEKTNHTIILDLTSPIDEIRKNFRGNWRGHLNRAERNGLTIIQENHLETFSKLYNEMYNRKQFKDSPDISNFRTIQNQLPISQKMTIFICKHENEAVAGIVGTAVGDTGIYLLGAVNNKGMKTQGSYLLQWRMIEWLKENGCCKYDLGGINPEKNPGVYHFKSGLGGEEVYYIGQFETCQNRLSNFVVNSGEKLKSILKFNI